MSLFLLRCASLPNTEQPCASSTGWKTSCLGWIHRPPLLTKRIMQCKQCEWKFASIQGVLDRPTGKQRPEEFYRVNSGHLLVVGKQIDCCGSLSMIIKQSLQIVLQIWPATDVFNSSMHMAWIWKPAFTKTKMYILSEKQINKWLMLSVSAGVNVNDKLTTNQISMIKVPAIPKCQIMIMHS